MMKQVLQQFQLFFTALQFLTRLPVPHWVGHSAGQLNRSVRYFPLAGGLVGGIVWLVLWGGSHIFPPGIAVLLSMAAGILVTGAFHEDGLSDYADGMGGGNSREQILDIMKDSRVGAYGAIALMMVLLLKYAALLALINRYTMVQMAGVLIAVHTVSRFFPLGIMMFMPYVRADETSRVKSVARCPEWLSLVIALFTVGLALLMLFLMGINLFNMIIMLSTSLFLLAILVLQLRQKLGGYTGDCLGAVQQITEIGLYLGLLLRH